MNNKKYLSLMLSIILGLSGWLLSPLSIADDNNHSQALPKQPISVTDFSGRIVSVKQPVKRIIALAPHITENVFSAGAGDLLVGTVSFSDYPEAAKNIQQVGSPHSFSIETVVDLAPDLVIVWSSGVSAKVSKKLIDLGLTVYMDEPRVLEDVAKSINDIGLLSGRAKISQQASATFLQHLQQLKQQYSQRRPVSMFYQIWNKPLMTLNGQHIISDVMRLCGGHNVFSEAIAIAPKINVESVIARNPEMILASGMGAVRPEWLDDWRQWTSLQAVNNQHLFFIHPDLLQRHTVRILQGADILCSQLEQVRQVSGNT